jgi:hypothetical protein
MIAKNFERFMKNYKFKKKFFDRLKKAPQTVELEEAEKKDPSVPNAMNALALGTLRLNVQI